MTHLDDVVLVLPGRRRRQGASGRRSLRAAGPGGAAAPVKPSWTSSPTECCIRGNLEARVDVEGEPPEPEQEVLVCHGRDNVMNGLLGFSYIRGLLTVATSGRTSEG